MSSAGAEDTNTFRIGTDPFVPTNGPSIVVDMQYLDVVIVGASTIVLSINIFFRFTFGT